MRGISVHVLFAALFLLSGGCSDDSPNTVKPPEITLPIPPQNFFVNAGAVGEDQDLSIDCWYSIVVDLGHPAELELGKEYAGSFSGEARRTVLAQDGSGISLMPLVAGEIIVQVLSQDSIELYIPINEGSGSRFWENLALFKGRRSGDGLWEGQWNCAPFDLNEGGWVDTVGIAVGNWKIDLE